MKNIPIWQLAAQALEEENPAMLLYVIDSKGSSPGKQGFFMVVVDEGSLGQLSVEGSIGGGMMEYNFVEMAGEKLRAHEAKAQTTKQYHDIDGSADQYEMISSIEQTIFMYTLQQKDKSTIYSIISSIENNQNGTLILSPSGIGFSEEVPDKNCEFIVRSEEDWIYREKTGFKWRLFIIGGGHCALALSNLMRKLDFYIRIYDDRSHIKTLLANEAAHEKHIVSDYAELAELVLPGDDHYVVIMTRDYRSDERALRALMGKKFRYLGVLGSRGKVDKMIRQYRAEGMMKDWTDSISAPTCNVDIRSESPEEIAVSIAGDIINAKNAVVSHAPHSMAN